MKFLTKNSKDVFKVSIFFWEGWGGAYEATFSNKTRSPQILNLAQHVSLSVQKAGLSSLLKGKACHYGPPGYSPEWTVCLSISLLNSCWTVNVNSHSIKRQLFHLC